MIGEGASVADVAAKLTYRTIRVVEMQVSRLGLKHCGVTKNFFFQEIPAEPMIDREEALNLRLSDPHYEEHLTSRTTCCQYGPTDLTTLENSNPCLMFDSFNRVETFWTTF